MSYSQLENQLKILWEELPCGWATLPSLGEVWFENSGGQFENHWY